MIPGFKFLPMSGTRKMREARKILQDAAMSMIHIKQERERAGDKEGQGDGDILGVMIEKNRENREQGSPEDALSEMEMVNQIMTFLAAEYVL
jgi:cytochrome P450